MSSELVNFDDDNNGDDDDFDDDNDDDIDLSIMMMTIRRRERGTLIVSVISEERELESRGTGRTGSTCFRFNHDHRDVDEDINDN